MKISDETRNPTQMPSEEAAKPKAVVIKPGSKGGSFFNNRNMMLIAETVAAVGIALFFLYAQAADANSNEKFNSCKPEHLLCDKKVIIDPDTRIEKSTNLSVFTDLKTLSEMKTEQQQRVITAFNLQDKVKMLVNDDFLKNLKELDPEILTRIQLVDLHRCSLQRFSLRTDCNNSELKYLLMKNEDFSKLTIGNLSNISQEQALAIYSRLRRLTKEPIISENLENDLLQMPLTNFSRLSGQQLNQLIDKIPPKLFSLLLNEQLIKLNLTKANTAQMNALSYEQISYVLKNLWR